ncbi:uncharacterized protein LOC134527116 isoform X2 [Bacillus rossius redtenbacheri]|uniref:uncharacterized protein LOC134527116 isoform X2 n=1 Tax=Bacillus rossius redtenbacheri TaxID=93214 RepID=UPI002FDE058C
MAAAPVFGTVATVAAVLGLVQGLIWSAASILGIVASTTCIFSLGDGTASADAAFILYVSGTVCGDTILQDQFGMMSGTWILAWSCLFLCFNFIWFCCSVWLLVGLRHHKPKHILLELLAWILVTICVCVLDLAAVIRFGIDVGILKRAGGENFYQVAPAVLMTVAARGYVLYLINVALCVSLAVMGAGIYQETKEDQKQLTQHTSVASLFQPSSADNSLSSRQGATGYIPSARPWSTASDDDGAPWRLPRPVVRPQPQHLVPRVPVLPARPPSRTPDPDYSPFPVRRPPSEQSSGRERAPTRSALKRPPTRLGRTVL